MSTAKPDLIVSRELQDIFRRLVQEVQELAGEKMMLSLCVFNSEPGSRMNYISNCNREDVETCWLNLINGWREGMPDVPAHEFN